MGNLFFMIYKHQNGTWSTLKEVGFSEVADAIISPFTVEVWIRVSPHAVFDYIFERYMDDLENEVDERYRGTMREVKEKLYYKLVNGHWNK